MRKLLLWFFKYAVLISVLIRVKRMKFALTIEIIFDHNNNVHLKEIISQVANGESLLNGSEKYISGSDEHEIFKKLEKAYAIKNQYLEKFLQQIKERNYD